MGEHAILDVYTSFDSNDCSSEADGDGETIPNIDHTVEEMIFGSRVGHNPVLLLERLQETEKNA